MTGEGSGTVRALVVEVTGREEYNPLGTFGFVALPRVGDRIILFFGGELSQENHFVVTECQHAPIALADTKSGINPGISEPLIWLLVQFSHTKEYGIGQAE